MDQKQTVPLGSREEYAMAEALLAVQEVPGANRQKCEQAYEARHEEALLEFPLLAHINDYAARMETVFDEEIALMHYDLIYFRLYSVASKAIKVIAAYRPELAKRLAEKAEET
ncbi:MAG: hypothetical protein WC831_02655 [Parcubacteria group bacterium]|jgi:hypothetical protein